MQRKRAPARAVAPASARTVPKAKAAGRPVAKPSAKASARTVPKAKAAGRPVAKPSAKPAGRPVAKPSAKPAGRTVAKPSAKASGRAVANPKHPKQPPSTSPSPTDGRRRELVLAAYQLIAESGLEELRTRDIAAKVGINISTLHYYFETKEDLIAAVVDHMTELFRTLRAPLPEGATALEELRHAFVTQAYRRRVEPWLDLVVQEMMLRARRDEKVRARLELMLLGWNGYVEMVIARGVREGDFARDLDPKVVAAIVTSYSMGSNLQYGVRPSTFPQEAAYERLVTLLKPS